MGLIPPPVPASPSPTSSFAHRRLHDLEPQSVRKQVAAACTDGPMPSSARGRQLRLPTCIRSTLGGFPAAHHAIYPKEQCHADPSPQAPTVLSLGPPCRGLRPELT
jgi:hypothetical protein